ncbi:TetR/AcrR family transcriptional regulator [Nocardia sp. 348MFTsu5.1]|uniref:TetR/AcrR family transcriptional regulator n=1 Tax=Nocardia sp. 348MFTsu5.1 TaxID=1172185 RepID=UPI0003746B5E|nr:TetR/AcrR family transcriptional regulator [Nocardia sp. 348MFTsu5.1]
MTTDDRPMPRYLQLLWGREEGGRRGPKPTLSIADIGAAAVALADERGWESVSMKAVAESLGLTTMSLYRYVDSRDELQQVMLDVAYGPADPLLTATGAWRTRLDQWARAIAAALVARPWVVMAPMHTAPVTPNLLTWTESGLQCFENVPMTGQQKLSALLLVDGFVRNHVRQSVQLGAVTERGTTTDDGAYEASILKLAVPERYPRLIDAVADTPNTNGDFYNEELTFGLEVIFAGLQARINAS